MGPRRHRLVFDRFAVDLESRELFRSGERISIQDQPLRLLVTLLERPGEVVGRSELSDVLWPPEAFVDREAGLNTAIRKLRVALRRPGEDGELLETIPKVGYRLNVEPVRDGAASVDAIDGQTSSSDDRLSTRRDHALRIGGRRASLGLAATVLLASGLVFVVKALGPSTVGPSTAGTSAGMPVETSGATAQPATSEAPRDVRRGALPDDPEARIAYLEARSLLTSDDQLERARQRLDEVVEREPDFADGHAHLAETTIRWVWHTGSMDGVESARRSAEAAHRLDPRSSVAQRTLGMIALFFDWRLDDAADHLARAVELDPADAFNHLARATVASVRGHHDAAIAAIERAVALDPGSMAIRSDAGYFLLRAGRHAEAVEACEMVLRLDPSQDFARHCLVTATRHSGDVEASRRHALAAMQGVDRSPTDRAAVASAVDPEHVYRLWRLERLRADPASRAATVAGELLAIGEADEALRWLERAAADRDPGLVLVPGTRDAIRAVADLPPAGQSRYRDILRRAGLGQLAEPLG